MKFFRVKAGEYATADGRFRVERDTTPYIPVALRDGTGPDCGTADDGWSLVVDDQVHDWFDTKREAVDAARSMERKEK